MGLENPIHLLLILVVVLLVFGAKRLPDMGRSLGEGMRGFKDAISTGAAGTSGTQAYSAAEAQVVEPRLEHTVANAPAAANPVFAQQHD